jgi:hypothetical protein
MTLRILGVKDDLIPFRIVLGIMFVTALFEKPVLRS